MHKHIVIVEPYEGYIEFLSDEVEERNSAQCLGLPVEEIADRLDCRITILQWRNWFHYEVKETCDWTSATRPTSQPEFSDRTSVFKSERIKRIPIPAKDPVYGLPINETGLSSCCHGLINDSCLLFFASYCPEKELQDFHDKNPFQSVVVPMWGGIGYVSQMARATEAGNFVDVPLVVVVTDTSAHRQVSNQEGFWTRHAIIRRQMKDVFLALADLVLVFGPRGHEIAISRRLPEAQHPVWTPRFVEGPLTDKIEEASASSASIDKPVQFFFFAEEIRAWQQKSGTLTWPTIYGI